MRNLTEEEKIYIYFNVLENENLKLREDLVKEIIDFKVNTYHNFSDDCFLKLVDYYSLFCRFLLQLKKDFENANNPDILKTVEVCSDFHYINEELLVYQDQILLDEAFKRLELTLENFMMTNETSDEFYAVYDIICDYRKQDSYSLLKNQEIEIEKRFVKMRKENCFE